MPNIENINKLIEVLKSDRAKDHFNMRFWLANAQGWKVLPSEINECGTVACIGGWCTIIRYEENINIFHDTWHKPKEWLGLVEV